MDYLQTARHHAAWHLRDLINAAFPDEESHHVDLNLLPVVDAIAEYAIILSAHRQSSKTVPPACGPQ